MFEKLKNCEGCRGRRQFLKESLYLGAVGGMALTLPSLAKAQSECQCIFCPSQYCLCCECPTGCTIIDEGNSLIVCDKCGGPLKCYGVGCGSECPPGFICTSYRQQAKAKITFANYWMVTLTDEGKFIVGSDDPYFEPMVTMNAHLKITNKDADKVVTVKATKRLPESQKA